jgi:hypothetical protein
MFLSFPSSSRYLLFLPFLQVTRESERETERGRERELDRERRRDLPVESCWTTRNRKREEVFLPLLFCCTKLEKEQGKDERFCFFSAIIPPRTVLAYCPEKHTKE